MTCHIQLGCSALGRGTCTAFTKENLMKAPQSCADCDHRNNFQAIVLQYRQLVVLLQCIRAESSGQVGGNKTICSHGGCVIIHSLSPTAGN
jgi:hypothetical protein